VGFVIKPKALPAVFRIASEQHTEFRGGGGKNAFAVARQIPRRDGL